MFSLQYCESMVPMPPLLISSSSDGGDSPIGVSFVVQTAAFGPGCDSGVALGVAGVAFGLSPSSWAVALLAQALAPLALPLLAPLALLRALRHLSVAQL